MKRLNVNWEKCASNNWCHLALISFDSPSLVDEKTEQPIKGVYIIWSAQKHKVIRVGSGNIKDRLKVHQTANWAKEWKNPKGENDPEDLLVTFAKIEDENDMLGAETYLGYLYAPQIGKRFPDKDLVSVNLPQNGIPCVNSEYPDSSDKNLDLNLVRFWKEFGKWNNNK